MTERKPDGGLAEIIEFLEMTGSEAELLCLLLELRRFRQDKPALIEQLEAAQSSRDHYEDAAKSLNSRLLAAEAELKRRDAAKPYAWERINCAECDQLITKHSAVAQNWLDKGWDVHPLFTFGDADPELIALRTELKRRDDVEAVATRGMPKYKIYTKQSLFDDGSFPETDLVELSVLQRQQEITRQLAVESNRLSDRKRELVEELKRRDAQSPVAWAHRLVNKTNGMLHPWVCGTAEREPSEGDQFRVEVKALYESPAAVTDRKMLRDLVDVVWNYATESAAVPATGTADELIDRVFSIPAETIESRYSAASAAPAAVPEKVVKLPEWFYPDGDIDCPPAVNLCDVKNALDAAGVKWVEG